MTSAQTGEAKTYTGRSFRLHNRRVFIGKHKPTGNIAFVFKRLGDPAAGEKRIHTTKLAVSHEVAVIMANAIMSLQAIKVTTYTADIAADGGVVWGGEQR